MRTLDYLAPDRQKVIANETMEVFAPIAGRLGINKIKSELEDLSLRYIDEDHFFRIKELLTQKVGKYSKITDGCFKTYC